MCYYPGEDDIPSLVLLPQAVEALDVPVAGCGGFSDSKVWLLLWHLEERL